DPHPNNTACRLLGLGKAPGAGILEACERGEVKALYLLGPELLARHPDPERVRRALSRVEHVVVHATHEDPGLELATVVFPDATHLETDGTFVNYQGRVQAFREAFPPPGEARPAVRVLGQLASRVGASVPAGAPATIFAQLSAE